MRNCCVSVCQPMFEQEFVKPYQIPTVEYGNGSRAALDPGCTNICTKL